MSREDITEVTAHPTKRVSMKDLPAEFFLPPQTTAALWSETAKLVGGSIAFIMLLGVVVALTQGIVITL
ncbi:MAG: hypothetical protein QOJ24_4084 [Mycobacterium sp.]|jgi:hypothetical protein|nr:hypothetical protein [Mycobacterium sp.]